MSGIEKAASPNSGWDCPLLSAKYPGFDYDSAQAWPILGLAEFPGAPYCNPDLPTKRGRGQPKKKRIPFY